MFQRQEELGALWVKKSKHGEMYFSGKIHLPDGELQIVVLPIKNTQNDEKVPQFRIVKAIYPQYAATQE